MTVPASEQVRMPVLARQLVNAEAHLMLRHPEECVLSSLQVITGALTLISLDGRAVDPEDWRQRIEKVLAEVPDKKGCCKWRY